jgi:deazaflavin-dependent oxidoreductase (nitroreductase family)
VTRIQRIRRRIIMVGWKIVNPPARRLAGIAPFWVILETTGRRSGLPRHTPLARGPEEDGAMWLVAVHGRHTTWVKNVQAEPSVRLRHLRRWRAGRATVVDFDRDRLRTFGRYARMGPATLAIEPVLVRVDFENANARPA